MERTIKTRNICYPSFKHLRSLRMVQQRSGLIHKLRVDHPAGLHKCLVAAYFGKLTIPGTDWHFSMYCNVLFNVSISNYLVDATDSKKHVTLVLTVEGPFQTIKTYTTIMSVPSVLTMSWYWSCHWSIHALGFCVLHAHGLEVRQRNQACLISPQLIEKRQVLVSVLELFQRCRHGWKELIAADVVVAW